MSEYGPPLFLKVIKEATALHFLAQANAKTFLDLYGHTMPEEGRSLFMEKYGVEVDKKKVEERRKSGEKTASVVDDPNTNVPLDPVEGTKPFEKEPASGDEKDQ